MKQGVTQSRTGNATLQEKNELDSEVTGLGIQAIITDSDRPCKLHF